MVHSKHGVTPGKITLACPLKPSVPPSTIGLIVSSNGLSSESYSRCYKEKMKDMKFAFIIDITLKFTKHKMVKRH